MMVTTQTAELSEPAQLQPAPTYVIKTYGCQMNVHDSERLSGLLEHSGYRRAVDARDADLIVFNTCAVRENADNKLYGNLSQLAPTKRDRPGMQIAVGGCLAQKDREVVLQRAPWVDVVFGTHNLDSLPALLRRARHNQRAQVEILESLQTFPSDLPARRDSAFSAWVSVSVGCDNTCTFCIVPSLRGKEVDRLPEEILDEVRALVAEGVREITLLGQNVNSYGRSFGNPGAFAGLLRACGAVPGLDRIRFTSPHPRDFTVDVLEAMAETAAVCPQLHMPLQSGSNLVLQRMRRSYRRERYLQIIADARRLLPQAAITTDIIVGFPGETEADFDQTLDLVRQARFASAYTFQYSPRPGTPAANMADQVPPAVVTHRYEQLAALQEQISWDENRALIGQPVQVLIAQSPGKKDIATGRVSGRARDGRLVHVAGAGRAEDGARAGRQSEVAGGDSDAGPLLAPGDLVTVVITNAAPYHLTADGGVLHNSPWTGAMRLVDQTPAKATASGRGVTAPVSTRGVTGPPLARPPRSGSGLLTIGGRSAGQ